MNASSNPKHSPQLEFNISCSRIYQVRVTYHNYVRFRGVIVKEQVRETVSVQAPDPDHVRANCKRLFTTRSLRQFEAIGGTVTNITETKKLLDINSLKIKSIL